MKDLYHTCINPKKTLPACWAILYTSIEPYMYMREGKTMLTETRLQNLALSARQLLECEHVWLCLHCPETTLRHPLLSLFCKMYPSLPLYYGSLPDPTILCNEHLWSLCDQAMLTGQHIIRDVWLKQENEAHEAAESVMIALLERRVGVVGFLFCTSRQPFEEGERRLLAQYGPELAWQVEQIVSERCLTSPTLTERENSASGMLEQSAFLSLISHELRAPLTAIKGYAGLLQEYGVSAVMSEAQKKRYLTIIMEQVKHLEVLIGDVLDVSHIQSGRLALHYTAVDLCHLCQHVVQLMQWGIDQQQPGHYCIVCTVDPELPLVWADVDRVQQILTNLVENAIKYSPAGGLIEIQAHLSSSCLRSCTCIYRRGNHSEGEELFSSHTTFVCITVRDQGIGIPHQQQSSLFKPFTRLAHSATRHVSGTGLGLYIARKLVEAMHGQVHLRSSEGKGTSITFTLPVAPVAGGLAEAYPTSLPVSQTVIMH
jgi:signal transduction histidine kinase